MGALNIFNNCIETHTGYWTTKNRELPISYMSKQHLKNALSELGRKYSENRVLYQSLVSGDVISKQQIILEEAYGIAIQSLNKKRDELLEELGRRNRKIETVFQRE